MKISTMTKALCIISVLLCIISCNSTEQVNAPEASTPSDPHSYARPSEAKATHLSLDLVADFDNKILSGSATYDISVTGGNKIYFDIKDLDITSTQVDGKDVAFSLGDYDKIKGQSLSVPVSNATQQVVINYKTTDKALALQWLNPQQTADKKHPFLFTQGQAILTRTWVPCQDSPGIRITYDADIQCPKELMAVMSASNPTEKSADGSYHFEMKQPIPPYLIALAIGDLAYGDIGKQTGVYAEPSMLEKSLYEFEDMQMMLEAAEELYGPYLWDRYDVIVLPPSFPFGGMENPRLTFATPTIIAGDKSLTSLIAHELAHSWSGNLVTNATWNDFWLNEGFTVYFERRIMEKLYGKDYADMLDLLGFQDLEHTIHDLGETHADTHLHLDLASRDPDDGMTDIAYEKGANFLTMLELQVGREKFDAFLTEYFNIHKFKTLTTDGFKKYITKHLLEPNNLDVNMEEWIHSGGLPSNTPPKQSTRFTSVDQVVATFSATAIPTTTITKDWSTHEWLHFIRHIDTETTPDALAGLDKAYALSDSQNAEIAAAWFQKSIELNYYQHITPQIEQFLVKVGRRKFLTPLYRALKEQNDLATAKAIYQKARNNYHAVSTQTIDALLGV